MEKQRSGTALVLLVLLVGLVSQYAVVPVMCRSLEEGLNDQKNYYSPDPHTGSTPKSPNKRSPHKSPSCGTPPSKGGGYNLSPPSYGGGSPPVVNPPVIVSPPSYGGHSPPVTTPPTDPGTPYSPMIPNTPPFFIGTCNYWSTHPQLIWGLLGYWGTVGGVFGVPALTPNLSLQQALANTRSDGIGSLYREGTASMLNSMVNNRFPFTTQQVRDRFMAALASNKVATAQAQLFKQANEGHLKLRA